MTDIILRFEGSRVYNVEPDYISENTDPCTDVVLTFDDYDGKLVTGKLVRRNEEQTPDDS